MVNKLFPDYDDDDFQTQIYEKREFQYYRIPEREKLKNYEEIKKYRNDNCKDNFKARPHQAILSNFMNPDYPYDGLIVIHGTGTGKTCNAIQMAEGFVSQVKQYGTKIYVLVPGTPIKENFKSELLFCTGKRYLKNKEILEQLSTNEKEREKRVAIYSALQNYTLMSYKTFYKKALGEIITEKKLGEDNKIVTTRRKTKEGEFEREVVINKIENMDNSLLIVDEAHNLIDNEYGKALKLIIDKSKNLKVILLTATPMPNLADEIVGLLNFIRPKDDQVKRDKIFTTSDKIHEIKLKQGAKEYLQKMARGYITYYRGGIPFTFAKRIDEGEIPNGLLFTKVSRCYMEKFQLEYYKKTIRDYDDALSKRSSAVANFVFPALSKDKKSIIGKYSTEGINTVVNQLVNEKDKLLKMINKELFNNKLSKEDEKNFMKETENNMITGRMLNLKYLSLFSVKFYNAIVNLNKLIKGQKGPGTAFVYSNLVKAGGIEIFAEALKENGYLEFQESFRDYNIQDNTIDYKTGLKYSEYKKKYNPVDFKPATFLIITGSTEDEELPEVKQKIIKNYFNTVENVDGKYLKLVLGSKVMNEGVTLENIKEIHILDVHYNLGKVDQVIGRGIRMCRHMKVTNDSNRFPEVKVYKYVVSLKNELSSDEHLYQKAELKYILVKKVERMLKEVAVDCPLLLYNNKFPEEIEEFKNCVEPTLENVKKGKKICPAKCDFQDCDFKCADKTLNKKYGTKTGYRALKKNEVDYSTFNTKIAQVEIGEIKNNIKNLYRLKYYYSFEQINDLIIKSLTKDQKELFDKKLVYKALLQLMPKTENDFNNFNDYVYDKNNNSGYLIKRNEYYIFQPFDQNEDTPLFYRKQNNIDHENQVPVENYVLQKHGDIKEEDEKEEVDIKKDKKGYDFDSTLDYYNSRDENFIVGVIDKNTNKLSREKKDIFKMRPPMRHSEKKRGIGIHNFTGAVCETSYTKPQLEKILSKLDKNIQPTKSTKEDLCGNIRDKLLYLEKYSTSKDKNKQTYMMIPNKHHKYPFPFNLEDRIKYKLTKLKKITKRDITYKTIKDKKGEFKTENITVKNMPSYIIEFKENKYTKEVEGELKKEGFKLNKGTWSYDIN